MIINKKNYKYLLFPSLQEEYELYDFFRKIYSNVETLKNCGIATAYDEADGRECLKRNIFKKILFL